jgi:hypothetical protein
VHFKAIEELIGGDVVFRLAKIRSSKAKSKNECEKIFHKYKGYFLKKTIN